MKTRPERDLQQTAQCVYSIPRERGRSYTGGTRRPLAVRLPEQRRNLKEDLLEKSKLILLVYEECHRVGWEEAMILEIESNGRCKKYSNEVSNSQ
jgi:predicted GIY-YIG superfamily endonuclease